MFGFDVDVREAGQPWLQLLGIDKVYIDNFFFHGIFLHCLTEELNRSY